MNYLAILSKSITLLSLSSNKLSKSISVLLSALDSSISCLAVALPNILSSSELRAESLTASLSAL